jgi:hypothetical protein
MSNRLVRLVQRLPYETTLVYMSETRTWLAGFFYEGDGLLLKRSCKSSVPRLAVGDLYKFNRLG